MAVGVPRARLSEKVSTESSCGGGSGWSTYTPTSVNSTNARGTVPRSAKGSVRRGGLVASAGMTPGTRPVPLYHRTQGACTTPPKQKWGSASHEREGPVECVHVHDEILIRSK